MQASVTKFQRKGRAAPSTGVRSGAWWRIRIRWKDGRTETIDAGFTTERDAEDQRLIVEARVRLGLVAAANRKAAPVTVARVVDDYLAHLERQRGPGTHLTNETRLLAAVAGQLGPVLVDRLTSSSLKGYALARSKMPGAAAGSTMSRATVWEEMASLRRALRSCRERGVVETEPPTLPSKKILPDNTRPRRDLTTQELGRICDHLADSYADLVMFAAWCPARPAELLRLTVADCRRVLDLGLPREERKVYFEQTKGGEGRGWRPVAEPAYEALRRQLDRRGDAGPLALVWVTTQGGTVSPGYLGQVLGQAAEAAGVPHVTPYNLRKYGVGRIFEHTRNLRVTARYSGHRKVETLLRYLDAEGGAADAAASQIGATPQLRTIMGGRE